MLPSQGAIQAFDIFSQLTGLIPLAGFILCIVGSINVKILSQLTSQPLLNAGGTLFGVTYCAHEASPIIAWAPHRNIWREGAISGEGVLVAAVAIGLPLILVRLIYAFLGS